MRFLFTGGVGAALLGLSIIAEPASAQLAVGPITLGSPGDPARLAFGAGAFDVTPARRRGAETAAEGRIEYRFGDVMPVLSPFIGVSGTSDGAFYGFGGFGMDINFSPNLVLTPNAAVGYFAKGGGTNLGSAIEFRTGAELAYRFADYSRLGIAVTHTSNAGIGKLNPGEQSVLLMYSMPFALGAWR